MKEEIMNLLKHFESDIIYNTGFGGEKYKEPTQYMQYESLVDEILNKT